MNLVRKCIGFATRYFYVPWIAYFGITNALGFFRPDEPTLKFSHKYKSILNVYYVSNFEIVAINTAFAGLILLNVAAFFEIWRQRER